MMSDLAAQARAFSRRKDEEAVQARMRVVALALGLDFEQDLIGTGASHSAQCTRLERLLERERLKGLQGHWSYDLNRHIALKQLRDRLKDPAWKAAKNGSPRDWRRSVPLKPAP